MDSVLLRCDDAQFEALRQCNTKRLKPFGIRVCSLRMGGDTFSLRLSLISDGMVRIPDRSQLMKCTAHRDMSWPQCATFSGGTVMLPDTPSPESDGQLTPRQGGPSGGG